MKRFISPCIALLCLALFLTGCRNPLAGLRKRDPGSERFTTTAAPLTTEQTAGPAEDTVPEQETAYEPLDSVYSSLPEYSGKPWVAAADGKARFTADEITDSAFEEYFPLLDR